MSGADHFNYPIFNAVTKALREQGHEIENPAENFNGETNHPRPDYMRADLERLLKVDAVVVLPGWRHSRGAKLELAVALELGLPIYDNSLELLSLHPVPDIDIRLLENNE